MEIKLTGVVGEGKVTVVDKEDYEYLSQYNWFYSGRYVITNVKKGKKFVKVPMQRMIMKPEDNLVVDHINGDRLDNRKSNLRVCTQQQNTFNRVVDKNSKSIYKGVSYSDYHGKWCAYFSKNRKRNHIGYFKEEKKAAEAYDYYAYKHFKEFSKLNFPDKIPKEPQKPKLTSKYRGVHFDKRDQVYIGSISINKTRHQVGSYKCEKEAAIAINKKLLELKPEDYRGRMLEIEGCGCCGK